MTRSARIGAIAVMALTIAGLGTVTAPVSWADPPEGHGRGHDHGGDDGRGRGPEHEARHDDHHFQDHDRAAVHQYYAAREHEGHCPPGLAKKGNDCMPPGHARAWAVGAPLPRGVVTYDLPPALVVQLTPPPAGYRYVRVASDVLMIAAGTGMVAAAIEDLGR